MYALHVDTKLTSIVVAHADIVADHVGHSAGQKMRLVGVQIDADTYGFLFADGRGYCHS